MDSWLRFLDRPFHQKTECSFTWQQEVTGTLTPDLKMTRLLSMSVMVLIMKTYIKQDKATTPFCERRADSSFWRRENTGQNAARRQSPASRRCASRADWFPTAAAQSDPCAG